MYQKQVWTAQQTIISADRMNHIEEGIANIELTPGADGKTPQLRNGETGIEVSYDDGQQWQLLVPYSTITGPQGEPGTTVKIYKTYDSIESMNADASNVPEGSLVMIVTDVNQEDNGKIYSKGESAFVFVVDISGMQGIQGETGPQGEPGLTPVITVSAKSLASTEQATVVRTGTDENPHFEFGIPAGKDGAAGAPGQDGVTPDISAIAVSVPYGTPVSVEKSGTNQAPVFTFNIPEGKQGETPDTSKYVTYSDYNGRKVIQLANYDALSGVTTTGDGANLIMMSKWDKVDVGTTKYQMNLNSPDGIVQINDDKVVATTDQIPDVSDFATKSEIPTQLPNPNSLTIKYNGQVAFTYDGSASETGNFVVNASTVPVSESDATTVKQYLDAELAKKQDAGDYAVYQEFVAGASDKKRKTIQLANADSISGISTTGTGANLIMLSQWDKVDIGSANFTMNLNSLNGEVQINDSKVVATVDQIPDVSGFATTEAVAAELAKKQDAGDYATVDYVNTKISGVYSYKGSVANDEALPADAQVGDVYNVEDTGDNYAWTGSEWDKLAGTVDLSAYAKTEYVDDQLATKQAVGDYALKSEIPNVSDFVTSSTLSTELAKKQDAGNYALKSDIPDVSGFATTDQLTDVEEKIPSVEGLATTEQVDAKTVTVGHVGANVDTLEIKQGENTLGKFELPSHPVKVNASLFIDDGSFYDPEAGLGGHPDFFNNQEWTGGDNLTEEQLAQGPFLLIAGTNTTAEDGQITTQTNLVSMGKDSALGKFYATKAELETKADVDHTHYTLPISVNIPVVTLQDKVYEDADILEWFGVADITELKQLIGQPHQFVLRYNITSGSLGLHSYQIPFQYVTMPTGDKSLKAIAVGLNPNNDTVSKITIDINFGGTVIEGNSNVKVTYLSLE